MLFDELNTVSTASECSLATLELMWKTEVKHIFPFLSFIMKYFSNLFHLLKLQTQPLVRECGVASGWQISAAIFLYSHSASLYFP